MVLVPSSCRWGMMMRCGRFGAKAHAHDLESDGDGDGDEGLIIIILIRISLANRKTLMLSPLLLKK